MGLVWLEIAHLGLFTMIFGQQGQGNYKKWVFLFSSMAKGVLE